LPKETLAGGFKLKSDLSLLEKNSKNLTLLFSKNDDIVPVSHAKKFASKLESANIIVYKHIKGHFLVSEFPEIVQMIKKDIKKNRT
jgi:predicted alpha/beta hydrolase family esterase